MWSSPVFFCRNGLCGQQKKPRRACGTLRGEAAACGPAASGNSDWQEILGEQLFGGITKKCDAWPKGSAGRLPGAFGGWGSVLGLVEHGLALALHPISRCRQHHACAQHQVCQPAAGAHRTASLTCSRCLCPIMPASFFCAVPRCFFSIISHPRCNLPESRGGMHLCAACVCSENRLNCKMIF